MAAQEALFVTRLQYHFLSIMQLWTDDCPSLYLLDMTVSTLTGLVSWNRGFGGEFGKSAFKSKFGLAPAKQIRILNDLIRSLKFKSKLDLICRLEKRHGYELNPRWLFKSGALLLMSTQRPCNIDPRCSHYVCIPCTQSELESRMGSAA